MELSFSHKYIFAVIISCFSRIEKNSWETHERRMKEQYLMAISDKDQQISHLQNLMRELRSASQTEPLKVQYQRQVSDSNTDCYSEVTIIQEASASCKLSACWSVFGKPFLWLPQGWTGFLEGRNCEQASSLFVSWQASPETSASLDGPQNLVYETELLRTQLNDSLKEIHQKELRIQQLNSRVSLSCYTGIRFLIFMTGSIKISRWWLNLGPSHSIP